MTASRLASERADSEKTLLAIKEFTRYLEGVERDLSRLTKRLHNREISQGAGFVGTGIHEAQHYLNILQKVIQKTQRAMAKKVDASAQEIESRPPDPQ